MEKNEQWKSYSDCSICRRKTYCSKGCKANTRTLKLQLSNLVNKSFDKAIDNQKDNPVIGDKRTYEKRSQ